MRSTRIVSALLAVLLAATTPLLAGSTAEAKAKPKRQVTSQGVNAPNGKLYLTGAIEGDYAKKKVILEQKAKPSAGFKKFKEFKSKNNSTYKTQVPGLAPGSSKTCYRVKIPASGGYRASRSPSRCVTPKP